MTGLVEGLYPKEKHENAPDFVMCKLSVNVDQFSTWLDAWRAANPGEEWLRLDMLTSRAGKGYAKVDDWKPSGERAHPDRPHDFKTIRADQVKMRPDVDFVSNDDIPF